METFVLNNIIFDKNGILIKRKKEDFKISIDNIKNMQYTRKRFLNYLFIYGLNVSPGWLQINFVNRIGWRKGYSLRIKYEDLKKLPKEILEKIVIN